MTDNHNDFDQPEFENGENLPPPSGFRGNLMEAWRTRPLFKLLALMTVVGAAIAVSISLFSGGGGPTNTSRLAKPPALNEPAGGPASPYFVQQTKEAEAQRAQEAIKNGGSALPTPIGQTANADELNGNGQKKDPLVELRTETEHLRQQVTQMQQQQQQPPQQPQKEQFDDSLAQAMQHQMSQMMDSWTPRGVKEVAVQHEDEKAKEAAAAAPASATTMPPQPPAKVIVPAGTVSYAELLTEANSDVPGAILAQILSGPLSGARAVGQFQVMNDYLVLQFTLADIKGKDYQINALALDPDTTLGGMATEVDERYFSRVILPAAAGFMQGLGQALSQGSSSVVTNGTTTIVQQSGKGFQQGVFLGLAEGAQTMGQFFENQANQTKPLVRVAAGTPMGLFFVSSVTDQFQTSPYPYGQGYPGMAGYPGSGYPGSTQLPQGYYPSGTSYPMAYNGVPGQTGMMPGQTGMPYPTGTTGMPGANGVPYPQYPAGTPGANQNPYSLSPYGTVGTTIYTH